MYERREGSDNSLYTGTRKLLAPPNNAHTYAIIQLFSACAPYISQASELSISFVMNALRQ